jgi:hypothetical protein
MFSVALAVGGYFFGRTQDGFRLSSVSEARDYLRGELEGVRERQTGMQRKLINLENNVMKIKVFRNAANQWNLSRDLSGTGTYYFN